MKSLDKIPTSKIQRATKLVGTGLKVGINYAKYYGNKMIHTQQEAKEKLDNDNATDIYDGLKELKGSALKLAQMLSMEKNLLPNAYVEKFSLSQFSVPPLSAPLVKKTFKKQFDKTPLEIFDTFSPESVNAASIGQVHKATKDKKTFAVKIQYPGIAQSISSDLAIVKPIAMKMFNIQKKGSEKYFKEIENKLIEETNYTLEISQSTEIAMLSKHIPNLLFPKYYPEYSNNRILTMDWMNGEHLSEYTKNKHSQSELNNLGQTLWDFYMHQIHTLKKVNADPHPGNFLVSKNKELIAIDFGCIKEIPLNFYDPYFALTDPKKIDDQQFFKNTLYELEILKKEDSENTISFFTHFFHEMISLFTKPFQKEEFDFSNKKFFNKLAEIGQNYAKSKELKTMDNNRGSKHFIYMNRTFFGLYNLMHELQAKKIKINHYKKYPCILQKQT